MSRSGSAGQNPPRADYAIRSGAASITGWHGPTNVLSDVNDPLYADRLSGDAIENQMLLDR
jgi:hypothetical protein